MTGSMFIDCATLIHPIMTDGISIVYNQYIITNSYLPRYRLQANAIFQPEVCRSGNTTCCTVPRQLTSLVDMLVFQWKQEKRLG